MYYKSLHLLFIVSITSLTFQQGFLLGQPIPQQDGGDVMKEGTNTCKAVYSCWPMGWSSFNDVMGRCVI